LTISIFCIIIIKIKKRKGVFMDNLKELRKAAKLTQMDLAVKVGVSLMTIQLWERQVTTPKEENLNKLKEVFNILPFSEE
jgi:transcriptional regulator with XRE-family HTH domain